MAPGTLSEKIDDYIEFFRTIEKGAPTFDIMLQNAPKPIGAGLSAESLLPIIQSISSIRYLKEETLPSGPSITRLKKAAPSNLLESV